MNDKCVLLIVLERGGDIIQYLHLIHTPSQTHIPPTTQVRNHLIHNLLLPTGLALRPLTLIPLLPLQSLQVVLHLVIPKQLCGKLIHLVGKELFGFVLLQGDVVATLGGCAHVLLLTVVGVGTVGVECWLFEFLFGFGHFYWLLLWRQL